VAPQLLLGRAGEDSRWEESRYEASGSYQALFTGVRGRGVLRSSDAPFASWDFYTKVV